MSTFLESDQSDFHPTDVIEDADGSLLVADTGSWYMICCPTSKVAKPDVLGTIYRIERKNAPFTKDPRGLKLDWAKPRADWLSDERPAVVKRAIDISCQAEQPGRAQRQPRPGSPRFGRFTALPVSRHASAVRDFLKDENSDARVAAIHSAALWFDTEAVEPLIGFLDSGDARERRLAAMALG